MEGLKITISNHPIFNSKRVVEVFAYQQNWKEEEIRVFTLTNHFDENDILINTQSIKSFERTLTASNIRNVDPVDGMEVQELIESGTTATTYILKVRLFIFLV